MTRKYTTWDTDTIGVAVAGWTARGGSAPTRVPAYGALSVVPIKRRYLSLANESTSDIDILTFDAVDADASRATFNELTALPLSLMTAQKAFLYARGQGTNPVTAYYRAKVDIVNNLLAIEKLSQVGSPTALAVVSSMAFAWDLTKAYFIRFAGIGSALTLTAWLTTDAEPAAPNITVADTDISAAGWVGLGVYHATLTGKVAPFNFFSFGSLANGAVETAVLPLTNARYNDWLNSNTSERCVLAEFSGVGYDSSGGASSPSQYTKVVNVYLSNVGYNSKAWDVPASKHYDAYIERIPTYSRQMGVALSGPVNNNFGNLVIRNVDRFAPDISYILTEDLSYLLQEDGYKILMES